MNKFIKFFVKLVSMAYHSFCMYLQYIRIKVICDLDENEHRTYFSFCMNFKSVQRSFVSQAPGIRGSGVETHWIGEKEGLDCDRK